MGAIVTVLFGLAAGYGINRLAMRFVERYTGLKRTYGGLAALFSASAAAYDMVAVEILSSLSAVVLFWQKGGSIAFGFEAFIIALILLLTLIDIRLRLLPDILNYTGVAAGLLYVPFRTGFGWTDALSGMAVGAGFTLAVAGGYYLWRREEGVGMGDVKLLLFLGSFAGAKGVMVILASGALAAAVWGAAVSLIRHRRDPWREELPFGPFLGAAAVLFLLAS